MARLKTISANLNAFLDTLGWAEGTSTSRRTQNDGYDVIVTGVDGVPEIFTDYSDHPFTNRKSKLINSKGLTSNGSGRYQIMLKDWPHYKAKLRLPDFSPVSQDLYAINLLQECNALSAIDKGLIELAVARCRHLWASLPGANYKDQHMRSIQDVLSIYIAKGGVCSPSQQSSQQSAQSLPQSVPPTLEEKPKPNPTPESSKPTSIVSVLSNLIARLLKRK